jgi:hypothetical protein
MASIEFFLQEDFDLVRYVYILSTYEDYGAEDVSVTLSRDRLPEMLKKYQMDITKEPCSNWTKDNQDRYATQMATECQTLGALLKRRDTELAAQDGHNLSHGWGGVQLHVVPLDEDTITPH